jgi:hypothetical protein
MPNFIYYKTNVDMNFELWTFIYFTLLIIIVLIIGRINKIKKKETSPERIARLKNQRDRKNKSKESIRANKILNDIQQNHSFINIKKRCRKHSDSDIINTPKPKRVRMTNHTIRNNETPEQTKLRNLSIKIKADIKKSHETPEQTQIRLQCNINNVNKYRNNINQKSKLKNLNNRFMN